MTTRRLIASVAATAGALLVTGVLVVRAFPLEAQAAQSRAPKPATAPVEIAEGGDHLLHGALPDYPRRAVEQRIEGDVVVDLTLDDRGEVSDARVVSGPEELRRAALESVLQWHFSPEKLRSTSAQAVLRFTVPSEIESIELRDKSDVKELLVATVKMKEPGPGQYTLMYRDAGKDGPDVVELSRSIAFERKLRDVVRVDGPGMKVDRQPLEALRLSQIAAERVSPALVKMIQDRAGVKIGDPISEAMLKQIVDAAASVDEHFHVRWERDGKGGLIVMVIAP